MHPDTWALVLPLLLCDIGHVFLVLSFLISGKWVTMTGSDWIIFQGPSSFKFYNPKLESRCEASDLHNDWCLGYLQVYPKELTSQGLFWNCILQVRSKENKHNFRSPSYFLYIPGNRIKTMSHGGIEWKKWTTGNAPPFVSCQHWPLSKLEGTLALPLLHTFSHS